MRSSQLSTHKKDKFRINCEFLNDLSNKKRRITQVKHEAGELMALCGVISVNAVNRMKY